MSLSTLLEALFVNRAVPRSERGPLTPSHDAALPDGSSNDNPEGIDLWSLLREDFRTHDSDPRQPGFWAVAVHRLGNARMDVHSKLLRAPLTVAYHLAFTGVNWVWGIDLSYTVKLGRRVRIWHHGGTVLGARAIGDDVHIRHNTTLGLANRFDKTMKPIIGNRVDIGAGAAVLGAVTVADDCVIGANSVVMRDLPPGSTAFGVPARPVNLQVNGVAAANPAAAKRRSEAEVNGAEPNAREPESGERNVASR
jgi:serine O-acetyltransferase